MAGSGAQQRQLGVIVGVVQQVQQLVLADANLVEGGGAFGHIRSVGHYSAIPAQQS